MKYQAISSTFAGIIAKAQKQDGEITVDDCVKALSHRSILLVMLLFALINSLPIPGIPGVSTVTGIPILLLSLQLVRGSHQLWLPRKFRDRSLKSRKLFNAMEKAIPYMEKVEKRLRPRLLFLSDFPFSNLIGMVIFIMGVILAMPIPMMNFPTGISITILTIGLIERDGFLIIFGLICACFAASLLFMFGDVVQKLFT